MKLYSTLSRTVEVLPDAPTPIGLYVCGITPYDSPHLGHARAAVVFDAFVRWLRHRGQAVNYVRNITDIDDKIIERCGGADPLAFTARYIEEYDRMCAALGCLKPDQEPRVSSHIPEIITLVERILAAGKGYASGGSVYFSVRAFAGYGALSGRAIDDLVAGARVEPGDDKRDPADFALWKAAKPGEPSWPSPWGAGRPGWHIECSAMAMRYLGETFEIHGGGNDLLFPHHENERAQSEAATGKTYAKIWMHNGLVTLGDRKMSKSDGNVLGLPALLELHGAMAIRYYLLAVHYGSPLDASPARFEEAVKALERFRTLEFDPADRKAAEHDPLTAEIEAEFRESLEDNFNTPRAFAVLFEAVKDAHKADVSKRRARSAATAAAIERCGAILGLELLPAVTDDAAIDALVAERNAARKARDFARADAIRKDLADRGIIIEDTASGTRWRK